MSRKLPASAFAFYLELGVGRSYEGVAKQFNCSKRTVTNHAKRDHWQERLAEAERAHTKKAEEKAIETLEAMDDRQLKVLRFIQGKAIDALRSMPLDSAMDAVKAFTLAIEKERLIRGEPTDRSAIDIQKKIYEETQRWLVPVESEAPSMPEQAAQQPATEPPAAPEQAVAAISDVTPEQPGNDAPAEAAA